jgi:hypothetical protein
LEVRYREHIHAVRTNRQNSKFAQNILGTRHDYDTIDKTMEILHIEKKGHKLNTLDRFHIYDRTKKGLQMNEPFTDIYNPIFDILLKNIRT